MIDAPVAGADEADEEIAEAILAGEVWVEEGSDVDREELEELRDDIAALGYDWGFVALAYEPDGGADRVAEDVLSIVRGGGGSTDTVVVLGLETIDGDSRMFPAGEFLDAVVDSLPAFERNYVDGYAAIFDNLTDGKTADVLVAEREAAAAAAEADESIPGRPDDDLAGVPTTVDLGASDSAAGATDDGGSGGFAPIAWLLGLGAAVIGAFSFFSRRKKKKLAESGLEKLRSEVKGQVSLAASRIVELDDQDAILSEESQSRFGEATATYHDVRAKVETASTHGELDDLGERMDVALWKFDLTEAELKGAEAPEKPEPRPDEPTPTTSGRDAGSIPTGRVPGGGYTGQTPRTGGAGSYGMGTGYGRSRGHGRRRGGMGGGLGGMLGGVLGGLVRGGMRGGGLQRRGGSMGGYTSGVPQTRTRSSGGGFPRIPSSGRSTTRRRGSTRSGGGRRTVGRSRSRSGGGRRSVGRRR